MWHKYLAIIVVTAVISVGAAESRHLFTQQEPPERSAKTSESTVQSPYAGQETRTIKALPKEDIEGLLAGSGTPFGGMAKPAELNGYPGPRHVLDAVNAGELEVSDAQKKEIKALYEEMEPKAVKLGEKIVALEREIDTAFADNTMTREKLEKKVSESADLYGDLRTVHLSYHFPMMDILSEKQIAQYNELRGYTSEGDPCENIPEGVHDRETWKKHNDCD